MADWAFVVGVVGGNRNGHGWPARGAHGRYRGGPRRLRRRLGHESGRSLIDLLDPDPNEHVLDVGRGTGELSAEIAETATAHGIDADESMIATAHER